MLDYQNLIIENNPWWETREKINQDPLIKEFSLFPFRYFHPLLFQYPILKDAVLTLRGPRRVGKSTLIRLIVKKLLLDKKVNPFSVFLFYCDRIGNYNELYDLIKAYLDFAKPRTNKRLYLFLDEISFITDWQRAVKELWDKGLLKNTTTLLTGSSILDLKYSSEWLAGRRGEVSPADIEYLPLTFAEFVQLIKPEVFPKNNISGRRNLPILQKLMEDYLLTGGFPLTINKYFQNKSLPNDLYDIFITWIENDLHKVKKSEETAYNIFANLIRTLTTPISYIDLAKQSGLSSHAACQDYLDILQKMFLLIKLPFFSLEQKRTNFKKNKKFYFTDPFIFHAVRNKTFSLSQNNFGVSREFLKSTALTKMIENLSIAHLGRNFPTFYYGKFGKNYEVDFVGYQKDKYHCFEIKYQNNLKPEEFAYFFKTNLQNHLTVISKNTFYESKNLTIIPLEVFLCNKL